MKDLKRLFKYVWPQWPRIIVVVFSAIIVSSLLSLSYMAIIPLLKVMIGDEGLHGWIDRKTCKYHYGLEFYVPKITEFTDNGQAFTYCLVVTNVERDSLAEKAGLKPQDQIVDVDGLLISKQVSKMPFTTLLEELATTDKSELTIQLKRLNENDVLAGETLTLKTPLSKNYVESLRLRRIDRAKLSLKMALVKSAQWIASFLPRQRSPKNTVKAVVILMLLVGLMTVIRCLAKFYQEYIAEKIVHIAIRHLRDNVFGHIMDMPMGFFAKERPSDSVSRIIRDTNVMSQAIKIILGKALREPLNILFMLSFAMLLNWQLTLIFLGAAPLVLILFVTFGRKMKRATKRSLMASSQMLAKLQEIMSGLKVVKVYNQQNYEREAFKAINDRLLKQMVKMSKVNAATRPTLEVLGLFAGLAALVVGVYWVTQGHMERPEFLTFLILLGASAEAVRKTSDIWNRIQQADAAASRIFTIVDQPLEFEKPGAFELLPLKHKVEFEDVVFTYPGSNSPVLKGINLTIEAGHNIAIVGPNGSGKTTLANLIPRFYNPDSGRILIDGKDIRDATLFSLRSQVGMVTQNIITFHDTIAANIAYGRPSAAMEEIVVAAKRAFAHEFISLLPDGYQTVIGEQGTGLSGGQLQRVVIARVILKNPSILIFDEATSQIDADSEAKIHRAIEEIMEDRTSLIIAHRFSTVITADVIVVMDKGRIIAQGQHDELMQSCALYQSLYQTQLVRTQDKMIIKPN
jgi:subfamily B ATP-binding cassette protein MsbA